MLERTKAPSIKPIKDYILPKPSHIRLNNGISVYVVSANEHPILNMQLLFPAGKWQENKKNVASLTAKMIGEGTASYTATQINDAFSGLGAFWEIRGGMDSMVMDFYALSRHLENILPLVASLAHEAIFPEEELAQLKMRIVQQLKVNEEKTNYVASQLLKEHIFGASHPYGYRTVAEEVDILTRTDLASFYQRFVHAQPFEIILSGDVKDSHIESLNQHLGSLPTGPASANTIQHSPATRAYEAIYQERPQAVQSSIILGKIAIPGNHPDSIPLLVLNQVLGGYFGSRLMSNLREEKGLTYGIYSNLVYLRQGSYSVIGTDVIKEKREEALSEIYGEIEKLCQEPVPEAELNLVKNYMAGNFVKSVNTPLAIAENFRMLRIQGLPEDYFDTYVSRINAVSAEALQRCAQQYLANNWAEVCVG